MWDQVIEDAASGRHRLSRRFFTAGSARKKLGCSSMAMALSALPKIAATSRALVITRGLESWRHQIVQIDWSQFVASSDKQKTIEAQAKRVEQKDGTEAGA
jgi:hypothetical protein